MTCFDPLSLFDFCSAIMSAIFAKSLRLSAAAKQATTSGEVFGSVFEFPTCAVFCWQTVNLMSNDSQIIFSAVTIIHFIWSVYSFALHLAHTALFALCHSGSARLSFSARWC